MSSNNSILAAAYPSLQMGLMCKACRGKPTQVLGKYRCTLCKQTSAYYNKELSREVAEFDWLYSIWLNLKKYSMISTGIKKLDFVIHFTFGPPHNRDWRDYSKLRPGYKVIDDVGTCLRLCGNNLLPFQLRPKETHAAEAS